MADRSSFDVKTATNVVKCVTGGFTSDDDTTHSENRNVEETDRSTEFPIVPLGKYFGKDGIP